MTDHVAAHINYSQARYLTVEFVEGSVDVGEIEQDPGPIGCRRRSDDIGHFCFETPQDRNPVERGRGALREWP